MLESFSVQVIGIIEEAKKIAKEKGDPLVGSEHLLLAMYQTPDSICRFLLQEADIQYEDIINILEKITIIHKIEHQDIVFTNKFQEIISKSQEFILKVNSKYVFDEHIFYCMLEDGDSIACEILRLLKIDLDLMIKDIEEIFDFKKEELPPYPFIINLSKTKRVHPYIIRGNYMNKIKYILSKKQKNNPLLIGNAGVGKTAIIEGLASLLKDETIYQLDLGGIVAGTKYRGELEEKLIKAMDFFKSEGAIVFIDEIHNIVGAGSNDGSLDVANILKPYLSRSDIRLIGATTLEEYYRFIEKDKALMRRFQNIYVNEPTIEEVKEILDGIKGTYQDYHQVVYNDGLIDKVIQKTQLYMPNRAFPDKAIDVLDEIGARYQLNMESDIDEILNDIIKDTSGISAPPVEELRCLCLNYRELLPFYIRFLEKTKDYNHIVSIGVEKEFTVNVLMEDLKKVFGCSDEVLLEVDLQMFYDTTSLNNLIGSNKGYIGYESGGILSEHLIKHPFSVIYFKNMIDAHPMVYHYIEHLMNKNNFYDHKGRKINLQNTIFILEKIPNKSSVGFVQSNRINNIVDITIGNIHKQSDNIYKYQKLLDKYHINVLNIDKYSPQVLEKLIYRIISMGEGSYLIDEKEEIKCI